MSRRRSHFKRTTRSRSGGKWTRAKSQRYRVTARRKGYGRTSGYYGRFQPGPGQEMKFHDVDLDDATIAAGANVTASINLVAQGVTESTRVGRKFTIRSINWRFHITIPAGTTGNTSDTVRVIMFLDKQCNGATASNTDILETADFQSFNNLANKSRFRTLMDRTYTINAPISGDGTTIDSGKVEIQDSFFKKVTIPIEYDAVASTITGIRSNNLGVILCSSDGVAGFFSKIRLRFSDS